MSEAKSMIAGLARWAADQHVSNITFVIKKDDGPKGYGGIGIQAEIRNAMVCADMTPALAEDLRKEAFAQGWTECGT